jgi:arylsulfatase A-like enzyme
VLLINTDDQRWDTMNLLPKTSAWMSSGTVLPNFSDAIPSCCPSRSAMFSGRYPQNDGVHIQSDGTALDMDHTLMAYLHGAGYHTAMAGKFLNPWPLTSAPPFFDAFTTIKAGYKSYQANVDGVLTSLTTTATTPRNYSTLFLADRLAGYIDGFETDDAAPWFAYYAPHAPHPAFRGITSPAVPEDRYATVPVTCLRPNESNRSDKPRYVRNLTYDAAQYTLICESQARAILSIDDAVDELMSRLDADGELANTLVVFTSDNGYLWGEHGRVAKFVPYLPSNRVPLLIRWDGHVPAGRDPRLASHVDLLPTILEAAGVVRRADAPALDGRSLLQPDTRPYLLTQYYADSANGKVPTWAALYDRRQHYIETFDAAGAVTFRELYDVTVDPAENVNLLYRNTNPAVTARAATWSAALTLARGCAGVTCP